jgi:hypothetical protein
MAQREVRTRLRHQSRGVRVHSRTSLNEVNNGDGMINLARFGYTFVGMVFISGSAHGVHKGGSDGRF